MSEKFKDKKSIVLIIAAVFLAVTIIAVILTLIFTGKGGSKKPPEEPVSPVGMSEEEDGEDLEDDFTEEEEIPETVHYNVPSEMRGVYLTPGLDFIKEENQGFEAIKADIDSSIKKASELTMNTLIIDTTYKDSVIYSTINAPELTQDFDIMQYIVDKARDSGMYTYAIFDASFYNAKTGETVKLGAGMDKLEENLREFAEAYALDGILIDGYANKQQPESYTGYSKLGAGIGYSNYMREAPLKTVVTMSNTIKKYARGTQIGLLAEAVWENEDRDKDGSPTASGFTSLTDGNADTRGFVLDGYVDFVAVKAFTSTTDDNVPFEAVAKWWGEVTSDAGVACYLVHASSKVCSSEKGWTSQDQLVRQAITASETSGVNGSIFNSLARLAADPQSSTTTLIKFYNDEVNTEYILKELQMTKPEKTSYTTAEQVVTFTGASDPNFEVSVNGEKIVTDASGYFTITKELKGGENKFTIVHKDRTVQYNITRQIEILKDISPTGSLAVEGGMKVLISAWAYEDAKVTATVNGANVTLSIDEEMQDESVRDSSYKKFTGSFTAPAATGSEQNLGNIKVTAKWGSESKTIEGASVKVNKKAKIEDGVPIVITADQAMTYPASTLDNIPNARYFPLPAGAMDYAVGEEIVYKKGSETFTYFNLASGMRVETSDITKSSDYASGNVVNGIKIYSKNGYTYAELDVTQKVSYSFEYSASGVSILLHNTKSTPSTAKAGDNSIFKSASFNGSDTLTLTFHKNGGFTGYKGYYDGDKLVFRFNDPPTSLANARIVVDPGHGGVDRGAEGFLVDYPEKVLNSAIAKKVAAQLEAQGAKVLLLDTSGGMSLKERVRRAEEFNGDLFVSIHNNTAANAKAQGTEVYFFYPYSQLLAQNVSKNVSSQLGTTNRGAKQSYYVVTLSSQMPSILVECGFMSNKNEYENLIKSKTQDKIASGIVSAISSTIKGTATGHSTSSAGDSEEDTASQTQATLNKTSLTLELGSSYKLTADTGGKEVTWSSGNTSVATVSANGTVKAVAEGTAKITAKAGDLTAVCTVKVVEEKEDTDGDSGDIDDIDISEYKLELEEGDTSTLKVTVYPKSVSDYEIVWSSSKTSVAAVNSSGKVTAVKDGTATITAKIKGTNFKVTCDVTVGGSGGSSSGTSLADIEDIYFKKDKVTLYRGTATQLELLSDEGSLDYSDFTWKSSNTSVATVDEKGYVKTRSTTGTAVITAVNTKYGLSDECTIKVTKDEIDVTNISINKSSLTLVVGDKYNDLKATYSPSNANTVNIVWTTSNKGVVTVSDTGEIKALREGTATITARNKGGGGEASVKIEVLDSKEIEEIEIYPETMELWVGEKYEIDVDFTPNFSTKPSLVWSSNRPGVVTVDSKGNIKGIAKGKATITVKLKDNSSVYAKCEITVIE